MSETETGRVPPHNLDAEVSVLGGILLRNDAIAIVLERGVTAEDFYHPAYRTIFEAMVTLFETSQPIDILTVADVVKQSDRGRGIQGLEGMLADCAGRVPTAENCGYYAGIVAGKASLRRLIVACTEIAGKAFTPGAESTDIVDYAEQRMFEVGQQAARSSYTHVRGVITEVVEEIGAANRAGLDITGVKSGKADLDRLTCGFQPGDLTLLAARPSAGKTALILDIARECGIPVMIFSAEMDKGPLVKRLLAGAGKLDSQRMRTGTLVGQDWIVLTRAAAELSQAPIYIDDAKAKMTALSIRARARRWRMDRSVFPLQDPKQELGLVMVDYLQAVKTPNDINRDVAVGEVGQALKDLARELNLPVVAVAALKRAITYAMRAKPPDLDDLRESGRLEYVTDCCLFLHRPPKPKKDGDWWHEDLVRLMLAKQRNGPTGTVDLYFRKAFSRFESVARRDDPEQTTLGGV